MQRMSWVPEFVMLAACLALAGCPANSNNVTVSNVVGLTQEAASTTIVGAGLAVGVITEVYSTTVDSGLVISQLPEAGTSVSLGSVVALTVSKGLQPNSSEGEVEGESEFPTVTLPNNVQLDMIHIPGGTFTMGSPSTEGDRNSDEGPQHRVTLDRFWMGKYQITQAQWVAVMGSNPSYFTGNTRRPVEMVSWNDVQTFITALNAHIRATSQGTATFRLPTEAEREYACRAGTTTRFYWGDDLGYTAISNYAWYKGNSGQQTHEVGVLLPNAWGLYDMTGNVFEWCQDGYGPYTAAVQTNPTGAYGSDPVNRGGSWLSYYGYYLRSAHRGHYSADTKYNTLGFRVVRTP